MIKEISTPKMDLATELSGYSWREQRQILKTARYLNKIDKLVSEELTPEEEAEQTIKELEKE